MNFSGWMLRSRILSASALALTFSVSACGTTQVGVRDVAEKTIAAPTSRVVSESDVKWGPLNPARGDKGPKAGNLWGDRTGSGPSGFLVRFADGFASPPHIHNVSYRGVVIDGLVHNDDPNADDMWMPAGSFWTPPSI